MSGRTLVRRSKHPWVWLKYTRHCHPESPRSAWQRASQSYVEDHRIISYSYFVRFSTFCFPFKSIKWVNIFFVKWIHSATLLYHFNVSITHNTLSNECIIQHLINKSLGVKFENKHLEFENQNMLQNFTK